MIAGVWLALHFLPTPGVEGGTGSLTGFFLAFILLFIATGVGNGSTFRMIPVIFMDECADAARGRGSEAQENAVRDGNRQAAAVLGFSGAIGAYGGFFIPKSYGSSIALTGSPHAALWTFIGFYLVCVLLTWLFYSRRGAARPC